MPLGSSPQLWTHSYLWSPSPMTAFLVPDFSRAVRAYGATPAASMAAVVERNERRSMRGSWFGGTFLRSYWDWCFVFSVWCFVSGEACRAERTRPTRNTKHETRNTKHET